MLIFSNPAIKLHRDFSRDPAQALDDRTGQDSPNTKQRRTDLKTTAKTRETETIRWIGDQFGRLVDTIDNGAFFPRLIGLLREIVDCDSIVALSYHRQRPPMVLCERLAPRDREALFGAYFKGSYLLSPFYLKWLERRGSAEMYRLRDIAPEGFFDSPYYTDYYLGSGLRDEVGYLIPIDADRAVLLSLGRTASFERYSTEELGLLDALKFAIASCVKKHAELAKQARAGQLGRQLTEQMSNFGADVLTEQERRVAQLLLRGHSSKSCARQLSISPTTERVHRRNIYAKLDISSQAELFNRFFQSLTLDSARPRVERDTR